MCKKLLTVAMTLMMAFTATNVWADYNYSLGYDEHYTGNSNGSRKTPTVELTGSESGVHSVATGQTASSFSKIFFDLTETVWEVVPGESLTPKLYYEGEWMHGFFYVDLGNDGNFDVNLIGTGPFTLGENNDLLAWNYIDGCNSAGMTGLDNHIANTMTLPEFTLPENLAPGDYRCRFKIDWNDPTPYGTTADVYKGGIIADVTLRVLPPPVVPYTIQAYGFNKYMATTVFENNRYIAQNTPETFTIVGSLDDGYTIQSLETEKFIGLGNNDWNSGDQASLWDLIEADEPNTYLILRHNGVKGLGWDVDTWGIFTDKSGMKWVIKEKKDVDFTVNYATTGFDAELGDVFSVTADGEAILSGTEFDAVKNITVAAEAGEGRMVTLTVNGKKVAAPYVIEECSYDLDIAAKFEAYRSPTATTDVYQTLDLFGDDMMELFAKADAEGRMFPTDEEFEAIGVNLADLAFVRSHVRPQQILDRATRLNENAYEKRNLWMNLPIGIGKEKGGYPSSNFSDDAFTSWNYTNLFGSWNHGLLHSPGVAADAAHKNGTDIMAGIKFFESWTAGSGAAGWVGKCQQTSENGYVSPTSGKKYKYVRPVVNALLYFGKDGINYNFEDNGYANLADFHSCMYDYAAEIGFENFHIGLYTAMSSISAGNVSSLLGTRDESRPGKGQAYDTFLNYSASDFAATNTIRGSVQAVENAGWTTEDVYQGAWIVSMARSWKNLSANETNRRMGIVLWGEHAQSRFFSNSTGSSSIDLQKNYQLLQDRFMSGGYRNPLSRPAENNSSNWGDGLATFQGIAHYIPERSAIRQNFPFTTYFSTGNGERYNYKGKKTLGTWYNLGQQDVVPTYRWLVYDKGTTNANTTDVPYFTHTDAYIGGSALQLDNENAIDVVLYRAELTCTAENPVARIALKNLAGPTEGTVSVIVKKQGATEWVENAFANVSGTEWEAQEIALNGVAAGDVIEYVGLRTSGNTKGLMVGMLQLDDDVQVKPADIVESSVIAEVVEECQQSLSVKLRWEVDQKTGDRAQYGMIYNDEANIDHFELLFKDGENGRVSEVGRTSSWSAYVGNIPMEEATRPFVGVRAVSIDGKTYTQTTWVEIPRAAANTLPEALSSSGNYPAIILDNSSDGITSALTNRYISRFAVTGSDEDFVYENSVGTPYTQDIANGVEDKNADKTNYIFAKENVIKVHQGQEVTVNFQFPTASDPMFYCSGRVYADWDCSEGFDGNEGTITVSDAYIDASGVKVKKILEWDRTGSDDEVVMVYGGRKQDQAVAELISGDITFTMNVPEDAKQGTSRLRMVFSDAWFPHPGASGAHNKGFAIDFPMEITGGNPGREAAADTHDQGVADEPVQLQGGLATTIKSVNGASEFTVTADEMNFQNCDKVWIYSADGKLVRYINGNVQNVNIEGMQGTYLVRMQSGQVQRTRKVVL